MQGGPFSLNLFRTRDRGEGGGGQPFTHQMSSVHVGARTALIVNSTTTSSTSGGATEPQAVASSKRTGNSAGNQNGRNAHATFKDVIAAFIEKARSFSPRQWLVIMSLVSLLMVGQALQLIGINYWLRYFYQYNSGSFTTFITSNLVFALFFFILLVVFFVSKRPKYFRFVFSWKSLHLLFWIGFFDAFNSWLSIYATTNTPEVLQALFSSLGSLYTFILSKFILKDTRNYINAWAMSAFALMILGVVIASIPDFSGASVQGNLKWWIVVYFISVPTQSFYRLAAEKGGRLGIEGGTAAAAVAVEGQSAATNNKKGSTDDDSIELEEAALEQTADEHDRRFKGADATVKFTMLFGDTFTQFAVSFLFLPLDALPWWGTSPTTAIAWDNFVGGLTCVVTCHLNIVFCLMYSAGFLCTYVGSAYLNHYSATLCSMVGQLASPVTALLLIIVPQLNMNQGLAPWYLSVVAIVLLTLGTLLYTVWEEMTTLDEEAHEACEEEE